MSIKMRRRCRAWRLKRSRQEHIAVEAIINARLARRYDEVVLQDDEHTARGDRRR